jgi:hypothetical protein
VAGLAAHGSGAYDEAIEAYRHAEVVSMGHTYPIGWQAAAHADAGRVTEARAERARLLALASRGHVSTALRSLAAAAAGDQAEAMELISQACDERDPVLLILQAPGFPGFNRVRDDPGFKDIRRRLRLPA